MKHNQYLSRLMLRTRPSCLHTTDTTVVYTPQIHYRHEFRRIDRLGDHHHTISMSELDENDQFEVCWVERNHSGTYFCYAKVSVLRELMCSSLTTSNCLAWHLAQHCLLTNTSSRSLALAITTSMHCATYGHCWHWTQPKPWQSLLSAVDWTTVTVCCVECRKRTLTGYSACRTFWRRLWHGHPGLLVH